MLTRSSVLPAAVAVGLRRIAVKRARRNVAVLIGRRPALAGRRPARRWRWLLDRRESWRTGRCPLVGHRCECSLACAVRPPPFEPLPAESRALRLRALRDGLIVSGWLATAFVLVVITDRAAASDTTRFRTGRSTSTTSTGGRWATTLPLARSATRHRLPCFSRRSPPCHGGCTCGCGRRSWWRACSSSAGAGS